MKPLLSLLLCVGIGGCALFTRTVYIKDGDPVRLREDVKGVKVWTMTKDGPVASSLDLEEGWYVLSMPDEKPSE